MQRPRRVHLLLTILRFLPVLLISLVILALLSASSSCTTSSDLQVTIHTAQNAAIHVSIEIANTEDKRQLGLMYRRELPELHGMLFLFSYEEELSFWMKNTPLPLDIIFISAARTIVNVAQNTTPFSEKPLPSGKPAQFVLEVRGGFCQRHGVAIGDQIELPKNLPLPL